LQHYRHLACRAEIEQLLARASFGFYQDPRGVERPTNTRGRVNYWAGGHAAEIGCLIAGIPGGQPRLDPSRLCEAGFVCPRNRHASAAPGARPPTHIQQRIRRTRPRGRRGGAPGPRGRSGSESSDQRLHRPRTSSDSLGHSCSGTRPAPCSKSCTNSPRGTANEKAETPPRWGVVGVVIARRGVVRVVEPRSTLRVVGVKTRYVLGTTVLHPPPAATSPTGPHHGVSPAAARRRDTAATTATWWLPELTLPGARVVTLAPAARTRARGASLAARD